MLRGCYYTWSLFSKKEDKCETHWKLSGVVWWLHDSHPLLQIIFLQHSTFWTVQLPWHRRGRRETCTCPGWRPRARLSWCWRDRASTRSDLQILCHLCPLIIMCVTPLRLVAAMRTLLALSAVTVIHEAGLARNWNIALYMRKQSLA